jgi:hypothetical protein
VAEAMDLLAPSAGLGRFSTTGRPVRVTNEGPIALQPGDHETSFTVSFPVARQRVPA